MRHLLLCLVLIACAGVAPAAETPLPAWARDYHTLLSHPVPKIDKAVELGTMAERSAWATGWYGNWWIQQQSQRLAKYDNLRYVERFRKQGIRNVFYFDGGEFGEFVGLVADGRLIYNQWDLRFYKGEPGQLLWFGADAFYRDANPLQLKSYRNFGLPPWTLPDGTRPASLYDFAQRSLSDQRDSWDYAGTAVPDAIAEQLKLKEFLAAGPEPVPAGKGLGRIVTFDYSNPFLLKDFEVGLGMMLQHRPDFLHIDNYFDNGLLYPERAAFGPWSLEKFRRFLEANLTDAQRQELGIRDPRQFNLKKYLVEKQIPTKHPRGRWRDKAWLDDRIWNLFVCSKFYDADQLFRGVYDFCKRRSRELGSEVVVAGNTIPLFPGGSLTSGAIDISHFEYHVAKQYGPIVIPPGLPPRGRLGGAVRLAAAIGRTGYCWPTVYVPKELSGEGHENLHKVLAFDCLANRGVLDYNFQYLEGHSPGSDRSAAWINNYIRDKAAYYGSRKPLADVGLVFPGQTLLASVNVFSMDAEYCLYDYLGWATALTDLQYLWDAVPDDRITIDTLRQYQAVVLPSVRCLTDQAIATLREYQRQGGRIVISGEAGTRYGLDRFLWHRPAADTLASSMEGAAGHRSCKMVPGAMYYTDTQGVPGARKGADIILPVLQWAIPRPQVVIDAPASVGLSAYTEPDGAVAVDLVSYALDVPSDCLTPATGVKLTVNRGVFAGATVMSPSFGTIAGEAQSKRSYPSTELQVNRRGDAQAEVAVPPFDVFVTVRLRK